MGIYIKGMGMPRSCISCHLNFGEKRPEYGLTIYCPYSDGVISWRDKAFDNGRLASCGIIPVPPHGRMGDLDELYASLKKWLIQNRHSMTEATRVWICGVLEGIAAAPTIIPAEADEERREYEAQVEAAQYCEMYESTYDSETGAM